MTKLEEPGFEIPEEVKAMVAVRITEELFRMVREKMSWSEAQLFKAMAEKRINIADHDIGVFVLLDDKIIGGAKRLEFTKTDLDGDSLIQIRSGSVPQEKFPPLKELREPLRPIKM